MNRCDEVTMNRTAAALAAVALCLVLPRLAHADLSHETLWGGAGPTSCAQSTFESYVDQQSSAKRAPATDKSKATLAAECLDAAPDQSAESNNLCFEKAGVPASVVPALAAKAKALEKTDALVDRARGLIGVTGEGNADRRVASRIDPIGVASPSQPDSDDSCTARPESCRSLPPIPPTLSVDAMATAPQPTAAIPAIPEAERPNDDAIPERLRISHSDGYGSPPLKPPRG